MPKPLKEFIRYELGTHKEKYTIEKRCTQITNLLSVFDMNVENLYMLNYSSPYLFTIESHDENSIKVHVEANNALIKLESGNILYNFITSRYLEC